MLLMGSVYMETRGVCVVRRLFSSGEMRGWGRLSYWMKVGGRSGD